MIRGDDDDHVARESIDLEEERANNTFDLTRLVLVTSFFPDNVKLVEEQNGSVRPYMVEETCEADRGFAKVTRDYCLIPNHK